MVMPASPMGPAAQPQPGAQPPGGSGPAGASISNSSPSQGNQVNGIAKVRQAIKLLEQALGDVGSAGEIGQEILKSIKGLTSKAPENKTTAGAESSALQGLAAKAKQMAPMLALQRAQGGAGAGGPGGVPGGGAQGGM